MSVSTSFFSYFLDASFVVQLVMLLLFFASFWSWVIIFQRFFYMRDVVRNLNRFEKEFWAAKDLAALYQSLVDQKNAAGLALIFMAGFEEFARLRHFSSLSAAQIVETVKETMQTTQTKLQMKIEDRLAFLATVGSVTPYVGLFGTVWGIMNAFQALGHVTQATISMVAPGISEALIATAMGLFAAIPAVIAYNRYMNKIDLILSRYEIFEDEFARFLFRSLQQSTAIQSESSQSVH